MRQLTYRIVGKLVSARAVHAHRIKTVLMCMDVLVYAAIKVSLSDSCVCFLHLVECHCSYNYKWAFERSDSNFTSSDLFQLTLTSDA